MFTFPSHNGSRSSSLCTLKTALTLSLFFFGFTSASFTQIQGERINLSLNADPTFNVSISNLPPLGCGISKAGFCNQSSNLCYTQEGVTDKVILDGYQGIHLKDLSGPDTFRIKITNTTGFLHSWSPNDIDIFGASDNMASLVVTQNTSGIPEFEALIILDPKELVRESEDQAKILRLQWRVVSSYYTSPTSQLSQAIEIDIPFIILGPTDDDPIQVQGITTTPKIPYLILHDPPGDGSFSKFLSSKQTCRSYSTSFLRGGSARVWGRAKLGFETSGAVPAEVYAQFEAGLSIGLDHKTQTDTELCITTTTEFETSSLDQNVGTSGDIFIGSGRRLEYGVAESLIYDPDNCTTKVEKALAFRATGQQDQFTMTELQIRNDIQIQQTLVDNPNTPIEVKSRARAQIKAWNSVLAMNEQNKMQALNNGGNSITFTGGAGSQSVETEVSTTSVQTIETTVTISLDVAVEVGAEVQGTGGAGGVEIEIRNEFGATTTTATGSTKVIGYTLTDDDPNDIFNIITGKDPMYGTPVFALNPGGSQTSCPYEGGIQIDQPQLSATSICKSGKTILIENVPAGTGANLSLNVCNQSSIERTYYLALNGSSNVNGAKFNFSGTELNATTVGEAYTLSPGQCFNNNGTNPLLVITQNPANQGILNYDNMVVYLYPLCEGSTFGELAIVDQINLSVRFTNDPNAIPRITIDGQLEDNIPPTISSCPPSRTIPNFPGACGERVTYDLPTATDNCGSASVVKVSGPDSNDNFFPGTTTVSFLATDQNGNTSTCSFNVTVVDNEPPSITSCPADVTINVAPGVCSEIVSYALPTAFDNCTSAIQRTTGPASGENFFPGTTTVTHVFTDNYSNTATCSFNVTVIDNEAPVITSCPNDITINVVPGSCSTAVGYITPTATDNCVASTARTQGLASGDTFPLGSTTVTHVFTDNYNNSTNCSFTVNVIDEEAPVLSNCPDSILVTTAVDQCSAIVEWEAPTANDNCTLSGTTSTVPSGTLFDIGRDTVTYTFSDAAGNTTNCSFQVIVEAGDADFCNNVVAVDDLKEAQLAFELFPNPARDQVVIQFETTTLSTVDLALFDAAGRQLSLTQFGQLIGAQALALDLDGLSQGLYFVQLRLKNKTGLQLKNEKLIISK